MSDKKAFALPAIHIDNMKSQAREYKTAYEAATKALDALLRTGSFREHYHNDAAWEQAKKERNETFRNLRAIREYTKEWMDWTNGNTYLATRESGSESSLSEFGPNDMPLG